MHGMIFAEFKKFVVTAFGAEGWNTLLTDAGLGSKMYLPSQAYPDGELVQLVVSASKISGKPAGDLIEAFGEFIVPGLVQHYGAHINPTWKTLDLLENTEGTIHRVVRAKSAGATPPELKVVRNSPDQVTITYGSARKLCALAVGIVKGVAKHYKENVVISQSACMNDGAPTCEIVVKRA